MAIVYGSPFDVDWTNLEEVKRYADKLGAGNIVYQHPERDNFNITHSAIRIHKDWIVYISKGRPG